MFQHRWTKYNKVIIFVSLAVFFWLTVSLSYAGPLKPPAFTGITITGTVTDTATKQYIAGAAISAVDAKGAVLSSAKTNSQGYYRISILTASAKAVFIRVQKEGYRFQYSGGSLSPYRTYTINFSLLPYINRPPSIAPIRPKTIRENQRLQLHISAIDPDGDEITLWAVNLPQGASFDSRARSLSWLPTYEQSGVYNISLEASDGKLAVSKTITIIVKDVDITPPAGSVKINNDNPYANSTNVVLGLLAEDSQEGSGLSQMQFSNDSRSWSVPESYAAAKTWTLASGDGEKTVYAKFSDKKGNWSTAEIKDSIILDTAAPAKPQGFSAVLDGVKVNLSWAANTESDIDGYNIYRSNTPGSGYVKLNAACLRNLNYQDSAFAYGKTYYYALTAQDQAGNESVYSNEASVVPLPAEVEPNNDFVSANSIQLDNPINGTINPKHDSDYFKITIPKAGKIYIYLTNVPPSINAYVYLYDVNYASVASLYSGGYGRSAALEKEVPAGGIYYIKIIDTSSDGYSAASFYNLRVKFAAIWSFGLKAAPGIFSPNADTRFDSTVITASLSSSSNWTINIKDSSNNIKRTFSGTGTAINQAWDGKDSSGNTVADGNYTIAVDAVDPVSGAAAIQTQAPVEVDTKIDSCVISNVAANQSLAGQFAVKGIADDANYQFHWWSGVPGTPSLKEAGLYYGQGLNPAVWVLISPRLEAPIKPDTNGNPQTLRVWDTTILPNGNYVLKLIANDKAGNQKIVDVPVTLYNVSVYDLKAAPGLFSPNADTRFDSTVITASLSSESNWAINIKDSSGAIKRTFSGAGTTINQAWDGKDSSGNAVSDGNYTVAVNAVDPITGSIAAQEQAPVEVDTKIDSCIISNVAVNQSLTGQFTVKGIVDDKNYGFWWDGVTGFPSFKGAGLYYGQGLNPSTWVLLGGNLRDPIKADANGSPQTIRVWDTTTLPNGNYVLRLIVNDKGLNQKIADVPVILYNASIYNLKTTPANRFSPNSDERFDSLSITASLSSESNWAINIKDSSGAIKRTFSGTGTAINQAWDGKDSSGNTVADGNYTIAVDATESITGSVAAQAQVPIELDTKIDSCVISNVAVNQVLTGQFTVKGIADDANYQFYWWSGIAGTHSLTEAGLYYGQGLNPARWTIIGAKLEIPTKPDTNGNPQTLRVWDTTILPNGSYVLRLIVNDKAGNQKIADVPVVIDNAGPDITELMVSPSTFTPDGIDQDITNDIANIIFKLSSPGFTNVSIYDKGMNLIKVLWDNALKPDPAKDMKIELEWDGTDSNNHLVRNGEYKITVSTGGGKKQAQAFCVVNDTPVFNSFSIKPATFSPDGNGIDDTTNLSYVLSEDSYMTVQAYSAQGQLVKTFAQDMLSTAAALNSFVWDGKDNNGQPCPQGRYFFKVSATALTGSLAEPLMVDAYLLFISNIRISKDTFNPYLSQTCEIIYHLVKEAKLSIKIYDAQKTLVRKLITEQLRPEGGHSEAWDGKDDSGKILADGYYYFTIEDSSGGVPEIVYDPSGTEERNSSFSMDLSATDFDTLKNQPSIITYKLFHPSSVTIKIRSLRYSGPAIIVLKYREPQGAGQYQALWPGRDELGNIVGRQKKYIIGMWTYSLVDNAIVIAGGRPIVSAVSVNPIQFNPVSNPYAPAGRNSADISFELSKDANVTVDIYSENNILVRKLLDNVLKSKGQNVVVWDGKNSQGELTPNGFYRIEIQAENDGNFSDVFTAHTEVVY